MEISALCLVLATFGVLQAAVQGKATHMLRASGTFDVVLTPLPLDDKAEDGVSTRLSLAKTFSGDLEGTSRGHMLASEASVKGSGAYVAIERITGTLNGRRGAFVVQHRGSMSKSGMHLTVTVVPDSGTDQLTGLAGAMTIKIVGKQHFYEFEYTLPETP